MRALLSFVPDCACAPIDADATPPSQSAFFFFSASFFFFSSQQMKSQGLERNWEEDKKKFTPTFCFFYYFSAQL